jgi:hypothetical protein
VILASLQAILPLISLANFIVLPFSALVSKSSKIESITPLSPFLRRVFSNIILVTSSIKAAGLSEVIIS